MPAFVMFIAKLPAILHICFSRFTKVVIRFQRVLEIPESKSLIHNIVKVLPNCKISRYGENIYGANKGFAFISENKWDEMTSDSFWARKISICYKIVGKSCKGRQGKKMKVPCHLVFVANFRRVLRHNNVSQDSIVFAMKYAFDWMVF